jgi:uncharacterized membrane protein
MLRTILLSIHVLAVIVWLGFGLYELLLVREIRRARVLPEEVALIRIYGRYAGIVAIATLVVAAAGVAMALLLGWGFFSVLWLGLKQAIMSAIILGMIVLTPLFIRIYARIGEISGANASSVEAAREVIGRAEPYVVLMRLGGLLAVVLAIWRPT